MNMALGVVGVFVLVLLGILVVAWIPGIIVIVKENRKAKEEPADVLNPENKRSAGFAALGYLVPIVGLILYLVWHDTTPRKANSAGKGALVSTITGVVVAVIVVILYFVVIGMIISSGLLF